MVGAVEDRSKMNNDPQQDTTDDPPQKMNDQPPSYAEHVNSGKDF